MGGDDARVSARAEELLSILRDLLVEEGQHPDAWLLGRLHGFGSMPEAEHVVVPDPARIMEWFEG